MADLIAQGPEREQRWRRALPVDELVVIGRGGAGWSVPWDEHISRRHVRVRWSGGRLAVDQLEGSTNPVFFRGQESRSFSLKAGEHFVIGRTTFSLADERALVTELATPPAAEQMFRRDALREWSYRDADQRIVVLGQLPDIIASARNDQDLFARLVNVLLAGVPRATTAAIVAVESDAADTSRAAAPPPKQATRAGDSGGGLRRSALIATAGRRTARVLHWDRQLLAGQDFLPSMRLILEAIDTQQSVVHVWHKTAASPAVDVTQQREGQWAFVTPLAGKECAGWALYVAGTTEESGTDAVTSGAELKDDVKFAELVATTLANVRQLQSLERNQASLRAFFSPVVLDALADDVPERVLAPRLCQVAVLFCDLRGFTDKSERHAENLLQLLDRVSQALGITTRQILAERGVVGDFHGDACMGFWGWPLEQPDMVLRACRAALEIQQTLRQFDAQLGHPLRDFRMGQGIATGPAVAGKIGTSDQVKVTVFGPVVNRASRLEGMTRWIRAAILIDEPTAQAVRASGTESMRVRRLAVVRPVGIEVPITVSQLLPPHGPDSALTDSDLRLYESALDRFTQGDWVDAFQMLHRVPADDEAKDFLTVYIAQHNRIPPRDWDGVIQIQQK